MRFPDWPARLDAFVEARRHRPFAWGENDCALMACDAVCALTGIDPLPQYRGVWTDAKSAMVAIARLGGSIEAAVTGVLGRPRPPRLAHRGDVVMYIRPDGRQALGVCLGEVFCGPGKDGLVFVPMDQAVATWEVA